MAQQLICAIMLTNTLSAIITVFVISYSVTAQEIVIDNSTEQIESFQFRARKDYFDNTSIVYFEITQIIDTNVLSYLRQRLKLVPNVVRFYISELDFGTNKCMIECMADLGEEDIILLINEALRDHGHPNNLKQ